MIADRDIAAPLRRNQWDRTKPPFRVHAFGGGVQSMALFYAWAFESVYLRGQVTNGYVNEGFFPDGVPDICIFADTRNEPPGVYAAVEEARELCSDPAVNVPFEIVSFGDLANPPVTKNGVQAIFAPLFTVSTEGRWVEDEVPATLQDAILWAQWGEYIEERDDMLQRTREQFGFTEEPPEINFRMEKRWVEPGEHGQLRRQCTGRYKIDPMMKRVYELAGDRPIEIWMGISIDESERVKTGPNDRVSYFYPLIFEQPNKGNVDVGPLAPMNRNECLTYLSDLEVKVGKSACTFCPYRSDGSWAKMKREDPDSFEAACRYDERARHWRPGYELFVHRQRVPLREAYLEGSDSQVLDLGLFQGADTSQSGGCEEGYCGL